MPHTLATPSFTPDLAARARCAADDATAAQDGASLLDEALALATADEIPAAMARLVSGLGAVRAAMSPAGWRAFATERCLRHPLAGVVHEDPFTHRAFSKPRGYAGDAGTLDLIYGTTPIPAETTARGAALYAWTSAGGASASVRYRRDLLAHAVDDAAARAPNGTRVLSLACGHLREADRSAAVAAGAVAAYYALDQDLESVALVGAQYGARGVTAVHASVRDLIVGRVRYADLALAYAAGLYDYLPDAVATRLTAVLFASLAPGGRLLLANFCPDAGDLSYMESMMDWTLLYRDEEDMARIAAALPAGEVAASRIFRDPLGNVVYLEVERA